MITVELVRYLFSYDPDTGFLRRMASPKKNGRTGHVVGCPDSDGYLRVKIRATSSSVHRLAWIHHYGEIPERQIDHINGDKADNRIQNLREATNQQNACNRPARRDNPWGYRGVTKRKNRDLWVAKITAKGASKYLGDFPSPELAAAAYDAAASEIHGHFARANLAA